MLRIPALRRAILADVPPLKAAALSLAAVALPTVLRWLIDKGDAGIPFVTFFPFLVLTSLVLGWRWGAAVAFVSSVVANRLLRAEPLLDSMEPVNWVLAALFALSCAALVWIGDIARRLVREQQAAKERETLLNHELMHRVKNMLATVNAMVMLTARHSEPQDFMKVLSGRMKALDRATSLLGVDASRQCEIGKLVDGAIEAFRGEGNIVAGGAACELPRESCIPLSLALHELCTNAAKHGALSVPEGRVDITWEFHRTADEGLLKIFWREHGGPTVPQDRRTGMGTQLLRSQAGLVEVDLQFIPEGVVCRIEIEGVKQIRV